MSEQHVIKVVLQPIRHLTMLPIFSNCVQSFSCKLCFCLLLLSFWDRKQLMDIGNGLSAMLALMRLLVLSPGH